MLKRAPLIAVAAVTAVAGLAVVVPKVYAATQNISCPATVVDTASQYTVTTTCKFPKPPPTTVTVRTTATATATVTATVTPSPTASPTASQTPTVTPTPTPTPTPTQPPSTGWPDASNTGWSGTLTAYTGPMTITAANTVIDSKTITGDLVINTTGVVVRNSQVNGHIFIPESSSTSFTKVTVVDSVIDAGQRDGTGIQDANFTLLRTEVVGGNRSINCWLYCDVRDSYVHGQFRDNTGQFHESGVRMGAHNVIVHNSIQCDAPEVPPDAGCSADLTGYGDFATVEDVLVQGNLFKYTQSGGFCAYGGSSESKPYSNANRMRFIDNVFERGPNGKCGSYGPITSFDVNAPGNVWTGNRWSTGELVPPEM